MSPCASCHAYHLMNILAYVPPRPDSDGLINAKSVCLQSDDTFSAYGGHGRPPAPRPFSGLQKLHLFVIWVQTYSVHSTQHSSCQSAAFATRALAARLETRHSIVTRLLHSQLSGMQMDHTILHCLLICHLRCKVCRGFTWIP